MIRQFAATAAALVVATAATAQEQFSFTQTYACDDGSELSVAYVNTAAGDAFAVLLADGHLHIAEIATSGSGALYVTQPEEGYSWHVKGAEGLLERAASGEQAQETVLSCTESPEEAPEGASSD